MASIEDAPIAIQSPPTSQANTGVAPNDASVPQSIPEAQPSSANQGPSSAAEVVDTAATDVQTEELSEEPDALKSDDKSIPPTTFMDSFRLSMTTEEAWQKLSEKWTTIDKEMVEGWREDLSNLLIFAGLFSAVVTTFVVDSYKGLQPDPMTTTNLLLAQISMQLVSFTTNQGFINSTAAINSALTDTLNSTSSSPVIQINALWFASLIFSLGVASVAILVRQWLREFLRMPIANHQASVYTRQWRRDGLEHWKVSEIIATLPVLMEVALALFFIGLVQQLLFLDSVVGGIAAALIAVTLFFLVATSVLPAFSGQCSYRSPQAWALKQILHGISIPIIISVERCVHFLKDLTQDRSKQQIRDVSRDIAASHYHDFPIPFNQSVNNISRQLKLYIGKPWEWQESKLYKSHDQQELKLNILQKTINMFPDDDQVPQALAKLLTEAAGSLHESSRQLESLVQLSKSEEGIIIYAEPYAWKLYLYTLGNILQQAKFQDSDYSIHTTLVSLDNILEQFIDLNVSASSSSLSATIALHHSLLLPFIIALCPLLKSCVQSQITEISLNHTIYDIWSKISKILKFEYANLWLNESAITISVLEAEYYFENSSISRWLGFNIRKQDSILLITTAELGDIRLDKFEKRQGLNVTLLHSLNHNSSSVGHIQFSPDGKCIAVALKNNVFIYNTQIDIPIWTIDHPDIHSVSFDSINKYLAIGGGSAVIQIWNITTQKIYKTLADLEKSICNLQCSSNGEFLVSGSYGYTARIWNISDGNKEPLILHHSDTVISVSISPNDQLVATGSADGNIYLWSSQTGDRLECLTGHTDWIRSIAFTPDGKQLISGSHDNTIKCWNISSVDSIKSGTNDDEEHTSATSNNQENIMKRAQCIRTLKGHTHWINTITVSLNGKWIVSGSDDRTIKFWDAKTGVMQCTLNGHRDFVQSVSLDSSGYLLATGDNCGTVHIWRYNELETED